MSTRSPFASGRKELQFVTVDVDIFEIPLRRIFSLQVIALEQSKLGEDKNDEGFEIDMIELVIFWKAHQAILETWNCACLPLQMRSGCVEIEMCTTSIWAICWFCHLLVADDAVE